MARPMIAGAMKSVRVVVEDSSQVGEARRTAAALAGEASLGDELSGRLALIVVEAATNIVRHGQPVDGAEAGGVVLRLLSEDGRTGVEMLAFDRGRGIADVGAAMQDGYSTGGTRGGGLGAIARLSSRFDMVSAPGAGTIVLSQIWTSPASPFPRRAADPLLEIGAICLPVRGERSNGDAWVMAMTPEGTTQILIADGLGHGQFAEEASSSAVRSFVEPGAASLTDALGRIHAALRTTRGAAVSGARFDPARGQIEFGGIGNVAGCIVADRGIRSMVSHNGTAGASARRIATFSYEWPENSVAVMHSDGLASHWKLDRFPGLSRRHPSVIAGVLYRDWARGRDDVTVVVCRRRAELS
ncbi:MAG TPA: ATP-binding protein [Gemmatimonadaceae bacterium]|nr:ATP-binding protein [Gemmatimonadaceae bacterium]